MRLSGCDPDCPHPSKSAPTFRRLPANTDGMPAAATYSARTDPLALIEGLDPEQIRRELEDLDGRARALRVLLRSALARQGTQRRREQEEAARAR
jgi:hypothetical protein